MIEPSRYNATIDIARQSRLQSAIAVGREQIASGRRIARASDDPAGTAALASIARRGTDAAAYAANAERARAIAASADGTLAEVQTGLLRALETLSAALNASASPADRAVAGATLDGVADDIDRLRGTVDSDGAPLFPAVALLLIPIDDATSAAPSLSAGAVFGPDASGLDLAQRLRAAANQLRDGSAAALTQVRAGFDALTQTTDGIADHRGTIGIAAARIDAVIDRLSDRTLSLTEARAAIDGVDIAATIARVQQDKLTLDAAQGLFVRLNQATLFDLLR